MTREAVVAAALDVTDEIGIGALSIRVIAKRLSTPPMSLYTHFANKEQLLDLMYAEASRRLYADSGYGDWQDELAALCRRIRRTLLEHPRWAPLLSRPALPVSMPGRERLLRLLCADGLPLADAFAAVANAIVTSMGVALVELTFRDPEGRFAMSARFDRLKQALAEQPPGESENAMTKDAVVEVGHFQVDEIFEQGVTTMIAGIQARLRSS